MGVVLWLFTFLGEKLLWVFACQDQLARNFTQQLDDESDVVCKERRKTQTGDEHRQHSFTWMAEGLGSIQSVAIHFKRSHIRQNPLQCVFYYLFIFFYLWPGYWFHFLKTTLEQSWDRDNLISGWLISILAEIHNCFFFLLFYHFAKSSFFLHSVVIWGWQNIQGGKDLKVGKNMGPLRKSALTHLHLWSSRLQSGVQTDNLLWQARRPEGKMSKQNCNKKWDTEKNGWHLLLLRHVRMSNSIKTFHIFSFVKGVVNIFPPPHRVTVAGWRHCITEESISAQLCVYHAGCAPDVGWCAVTGTYKHLERAVLSGLDVVGEMFVLPEGGKQKCSSAKF